jgi:hypothetical protein
MTSKEYDELTLEELETKRREVRAEVKKLQRSGDRTAALKDLKLENLRLKDAIAVRKVSLSSPVQQSGQQKEAHELFEAA